MKRALLVLTLLSLVLLSPPMAVGKDKGAEKKKKKRVKKKGWWYKNNFIKDLKRWGIRMAPHLEVTSQKTPPHWVKDLPKKPLFSFVQIADLHLWRYNTRTLDRARDYINKNLKPDFAVFTGDNVSGPDRAGHQKFLKKYLDQKLGMKYFIIRGDNDAAYYERNFGSSYWSFVYGGVQFVGAALDFDLDWVGIGTFERHQWLEEQFKKPYPTVFFIHQPVQPPNFLNALSVRNLIARYPNVILVSAGHIHYDFEARYKHTLHVAALSLERHPQKGFKHYLVYKDRIVIKTYEVFRGKYQFANKWQMVKIPSKYRPRGPRKVENFKAQPFSEIYHARDIEELVEALLSLRIQRGLKKLADLYDQWEKEMK